MDINKVLPNASSKYGAPMGRAAKTGGGFKKLRLQKLKFVDIDYDTGGAYWGNNGTPVWCAFTDNLKTIIFVREKTRKEAIKTIRKIHAWEAPEFRKH